MYVLCVPWKDMLAKMENLIKLAKGQRWNEAKIFNYGVKKKKKKTILIICKRSLCCSPFASILYFDNLNASYKYGINPQLLIHQLPLSIWGIEATTAEQARRGKSKAVGFQKSGF